MAEIKNKSVSVWLILRDGPNKGKVALQQRSEKEKRYQFFCQATWSGKVEEGEKVESAVKRECEEELGKKFKDNFNFSSLEFIGSLAFAAMGKNWESYNYLGKIFEQDLRLASLHKEAEPEFLFASKDTQVFGVISAKSPRFNIVLFDDQYKIFRKIFNGGNIIK